MAKVKRKKIWVPLGEFFTHFRVTKFYEETVDFNGMSLEEVITWSKSMQEKYTEGGYEKIEVKSQVDYARYPDDSDRTYYRLEGYREMNDDEITKEKADEDARKQNIADMELRQYERLKAKFEGNK